MKKRMLCLILVFAVLCGLGQTACAADSSPEAAAEALYRLGLFKGTGAAADGSPVFALDQPMTREAAVTMLVRLLGKEPEALSGTWSTPFTDVLPWARPYVGYAYAKGLTRGTGKTTFTGTASVTAAQYLTMMLRALRYADGVDFSWDDPWTLSDALGLTAGGDPAQTGGDFLRGDAAVLSHAALAVCPKGASEPLLSLIFPAVPMERSLSDAQIAALDGKRPEELRAALSTMADAKAFLNRRFPKLWMSRHSYWQEQDETVFCLSSGAEVLLREDEPGRSDLVTAMTYLLDDDCEICSLYGFWTDGEELGPIKAINGLRSGSSWIFFDPVLGMDGDLASRAGALLPEAKAAGIGDYVAQLRQTPVLQEIDSLYAITGGQPLNGTVRNEWAALTLPDTAPVYANEERHLSDEAYEELKYGHVKAENIGKYKLPTLLGGLTLSPTEAKALVGQPMEVLQEQVKTAGDLLQYMLAAGMRLKQDGDETVFLDGEEWHYNSSARQTLAENRGNCGRMANVANALLADDYEEVGFILHSYYPGEGGGHVYNYIKEQGRYYIVDFSSYLFRNYSVEDEVPVLVLDQLADYGTRWRELRDHLAAIIAHTSDGTHLPNVWRDDGYYFPEDAVFQVLYETPGTGYKVRTLPLDASRLDWRSMD